MIAIDLTKPNFLHQLGTGLLGSCFRMKNGYAMAVLTGGDPIDVSTSGTRAVFFLNELQRDVNFERRVVAELEPTGLIAVEEFERRGCFDRIIKVAPKDLEAVFLATMNLC
jgi:hypothetical protein